MGQGAVLLVRNTGPSLELETFADPGGYNQLLRYRLKLTVSGRVTVRAVYRTPVGVGQWACYGHCLIDSDLATPRLIGM